jgi:tetratricopeptide (TPR) repeat protein
MFCTSCGTKNQEESNYCKQCGHSLEKSTLPRISQADFDRALPDEEQVSALLERAYRFRKDGDLPAAVSLCEEALRLRPESTSAHSLLGQLYEQQGDREQAIREYECVLLLNPGSIADRVKLDELRGDGVPAGRARVTMPHIMLVDHRSNPIHVHPALVAALVAGAAMLVVGCVLFAKLHPDNTPERTAAALNPPTQTPTNPGTISGGNPAGRTAVASTAGSSVLPAQNPNVAGANTPPGNYPSYPYPAKDTYVGRRPSGRSGTAPPVNVQPLSGQDNQDDSGDDSSERVRLAADGGKVYHLKITSDGEKKADSNAEPVGSRIRIHTDGNSSDNGGSTADSESSAMIHVGEDKMMKEDYAGAITAFRKALPSAGDETGYIYQQLGMCFQRRNDKNNAIANFTKAIDAYKKLLSAGRKTDIARDSIRVCEHGIKACSD